MNAESEAPEEESHWSIKLMISLTSKTLRTVNLGLILLISHKPSSCSARQLALWMHSVKATQTCVSGRLDSMLTQVTAWVPLMFHPHPLVILCSKTSQAAGNIARLLMSLPVSTASGVSPRLKRPSAQARMELFSSCPKRSLRVRA